MNNFIVSAFDALGTPSRFPLLRQSVFVIAVVAMIGMLQALLSIFIGSPVVMLAALFFLLGASLAILGKLVLANRFAGLRDARHAPFHQSDSRLMPSQRRTLTKLIEQVHLAPTPLALGLEASWGMGKSIVVEHLLAELKPNSKQGVVAVRVNVWEYENYSDMQYGVMQALLAHPKVLGGFGWLAYPWWMVLREWGGLHFRSFRFGWGRHEVKADGQLRLPWQNRLERIVARQHLAGRRIVLVLDEMERASAPATQAALTLLQRSLSLPGVATVVPFVPEVIRFKAFHPSMVVLDDLRDTISGYLEGEHVRWQSDRRKNQPDDLSQAITKVTNKARYIELTQEFCRLATEADWRAYYRRMEERYLRQRIRLPWPDYLDMSDFVQLPEVKVNFADFGEEKIADLRAWIEKTGSQGEKGGLLGAGPLKMPLRWLKGYLMLLSSAPANGNVDIRFFFLLALHCAVNEMDED